MVLGENVIRLNYITNVLLTIKVATYDLSVADKPESETIVAQPDETTSWHAARVEVSTGGGRPVLLEYITQSPKDPHCEGLDSTLGFPKEYCSENYRHTVSQMLQSFGIIPFYFATRLIPAIPASLQYFVFRLHRDYGGYSGPCDIVDLPLTMLLAYTCHAFTQFCLPHDSNSWLLGVFAELICTRREDSKLQNLAFMTRYLGHGSKQKTVTGFLSLVTEAVWHLPALRTLELWNASDGFGCLFRCTLDHHRIIVKWRCIDERFTLEDEVIEKWTELAKASGRSSSYISYRSYNSDG
ncbi:hypothetical protein FG05_05362 [Fusarium graminearum]|nr:hypothetical protein FG05_05362 [Fusarium graminearum]